MAEYIVIKKAVYDIPFYVEAESENEALEKAWRNEGCLSDEDQHEFVEYLDSGTWVVEWNRE